MTGLSWFDEIRRGALCPLGATPRHRVRVADLWNRGNTTRSQDDARVYRGRQPWEPGPRVIGCILIEYAPDDVLVVPFDVDDLDEPAEVALDRQRAIERLRRGERRRIEKVDVSARHAVGLRVGPGASRMKLIHSLQVVYLGRNHVFGAVGEIDVVRR